MNKSSIYVIVLTWNNYKDTRECLDSLLKVAEPDIKILLVDNASTDDSITRLKGDFPNIDTLRLRENSGISGGYNAGIDYAMQAAADYIIVTNNDITFAPDTINGLLRAAQTTPKMGIGVPKTFNYYDHALLAGIGGRWRKFPPSVKMMGVNTPDSNMFSSNQMMDYAISSCYLITKDLVKSIGGYDTGYFFYNDDWDYSIRAREAGYEIWLIPDARVWHKVSVSTQKSKKKEIWWEYFGRSTFRFYTKHRNNFELLLYAMWFVIRESIKLNFDRIFPFIKGLRYESRK